MEAATPLEEELVAAAMLNDCGTMNSCLARGASINARMHVSTAAGWGGGGGDVAVSFAPAA
jgi:hypothetical protein